MSKDTDLPVEPMFSYSDLHNSMGVRLTRALFKETCTSKDKPLFTLSHNESEGYVKLRDVFLKYVEDDPTEYLFAIVVFGSYEFWDNLKTAPWLQDHLKAWRHEADVRRKQKAFKAILEEATSDKSSPSRLQAARYLIEEPWKDKRAAKVKEEVQRSTSKAKDHYSSDVARLRDYLK